MFDSGFTDYRREGGGIAFKKPDGSEFFHAGPDAEQLAATIEASRPPDMRTAQYDPSAPLGSTASIPDAGPPPPPLAPDVGPNMSGGPVMTDGPEMAPPGGMTMNAPAPPGPQGAPPGPPLPPPTAAGQMDELGQLPPDFLSGRVRTRGYNPAAADANAVAVRKGQTTTTEGAHEYSKELQQGYADVEEARQDAAINHWQAQQAVADAQIARSEAELPDILKKQAEAQQKVAAIQAKVKDAQVNLEDLSRDASDAKLNGGSIWGGGTAAGIGTMIGAMMTSMSSALLGRGPSGFDVINQAIERDVRNQRAEIERKGAKANNALALYKARFGDLDTAEQALKIVQTQKAESLAQRAAGLSGTVEALQAYNKFSIDAKQAELDRRKQFETDVHGKQVIQTTSEFKQPVAAGSRDLTPDEMLKRLEVVGKRTDIGLKQDKLRRAQSGEDPDLTAAEKLAIEKDERERSVRMIDGKRVFMPDKERRAAYDEISKAHAVMTANANDIRGILSTPGSSWTWKEQGAARALAKDMFNTAGPLFDKGALSTDDRKDLSALAAEGGMEKFGSRDEALAALNKAMERVDQRLQIHSRELYDDPKLKTPTYKTASERTLNEGDVGETYVPPK